MVRTLDITRDDRAPLVARHALDDLSAEIGDFHLMRDARLLVTELVSNAVRHGAGETVRLIVDRPRDGHLRCEVIDEGQGFLPVANRGSDGGWGLQLVETLAQSWGVREGSTHVWFELAPAQEKSGR